MDAVKKKGKKLTVELVSISKDPAAMVRAAARQCYSKIKMLPEKARKELDGDDKEYSLMNELFKAGHHTTFQHTYFTFHFDNISRGPIQSFFHMHPFYNTEQQSQRFTEVKPDQFMEPNFKLDSSKEKYWNLVENITESYSVLCDVLSRKGSHLYNTYCQMYAKSNFEDGSDPSEDKLKKIMGIAGKKAQENARCLLPLSTTCKMHYSFSTLALIKMAKLSNAGLVFGDEINTIVKSMIDQIENLYPDAFSIEGKKIDLSSFNNSDLTGNQLFNSRLEDRLDFVKEFDSKLGDYDSKLVTIPTNQEEVLADAVRTALCLPSSRLSDEQAIDLLLGSENNPLINSEGYVGHFDNVMRAMQAFTLENYKKIPFFELAQEQRHRETPILNADLSLMFSDPNMPLEYFIPERIRENNAANEIFVRQQVQTDQVMKDLIRGGEDPSECMYLLTNSHYIRMVQRNTLVGAFWKYAKRLCYNAQDKIFDTAGQEVKQIVEKFPAVGKHLLPPCSHRSEGGVKPACPEGKRYCGVPVWKYDNLEEIIDGRKF